MDMSQVEALKTWSLPGIFTIIIVVFLAGSVILELCAKRWKPWSHFFRWIANMANTPIYEKLDNLEHKINKIQYENAERDIINCRVRILRFGDELRLDQKHSKESFDQIMDDISNYKRYCEAHPEFQNNRTVLTVEKIETVYAHCMDNNDFL